MLTSRFGALERNSKWNQHVRFFQPWRALPPDEPHFCTRCRKYFNADMTDLADPGSHYTRRVVDTAVRLVVEDGLPYRTASWSLWRDHRVFVPYATIQNWVEDGGEKGGAADPDRLPRLGALGLLGLHRRRRAV
jgi:hypothetical protein